MTNVVDERTPPVSTSVLVRCWVRDCPARPVVEQCWTRDGGHIGYACGEHRRPTPPAAVGASPLT